MNKGQYIDKLEKMIENKVKTVDKINNSIEIIDEGYQEWEIYCWDEENDIDIRNPYFRIGDYKWLICFFQKKNCFFKSLLLLIFIYIYIFIRLFLIFIII